MEYTLHEIAKKEYPLLDNFLYEAIFIRSGMEKPPKIIIQKPELQLYFKDFGLRKHDKGIVAKVDGNIIGAVWTRIMNDYGHIDHQTPSLAISLYEAYRGHGIGTAMMKAMLSLLKKSGYEKVSLSVDKENYAVKLYQHMGFRIVAQNDEDYIMVCTLLQVHSLS